MNKKEFIIEAALRMVSQGMPVMDIPQAARQLADELYPEAPVHHGKPETDPIEVLIDEVRRVEEQHVKEKEYRSQKSGLDVRLGKVFYEKDIETVGQLLQLGRDKFRRLRKVGSLCVDIVNEALANLYNITVW